VAGIPALLLPKITFVRLLPSSNVRIRQRRSQITGDEIAGATTDCYEIEV
jgi:hypothetical protein